MKKFSYFRFRVLLLSLLMVGIITSCSSEDTEVTSSSSLLSVKQSLNPGYTARGAADIYTVFVVNSANYAAIQFTNEIRAYYKPGMSFSDLKHELDPVGIFLR